MEIESAMAKAANRIGCDLPAIKAVFRVEAAGKFFGSDGKPVRRFEPHHFPRKWWGKIGFNPGGQAKWRASLKLSRKVRERMYAQALVLDREAAARATSYGAPQIMGFNHEAAGYSSAIEMMTSFTSAGEQIKAFAELILSWGIDGAVRAHDWLGFARRYNGSGQAPRYARAIAGAYRRENKGVASSNVLRLGSRGQSVAALQERLRGAGYEVDVDANFGGQTHEAVLAFQRKVGIKVDGIVGGRTWEKLNAVQHSDIVTKPEPQDEPTFFDVLASILAKILGGDK